MRHLAPLLTCAAFVALASCSTAGRDADKNETGIAKQAANRAAPSSTTTEILPWSETGLGFMPSVTERLARGPAAIAVDPRSGAVFVLDNVHERVVRVAQGELSRFAAVPADSDDLAVGPDGAIAVRRAIKPEVLVLDRRGGVVGRVDTSAVEVDHIQLLASRRVAVTSPYQETFVLGSPALPQLPEAVTAGKREGAASLPDGSGVVAVRRDDGELELRVLRSVDGQQDNVIARHPLGHGSAATIVGASGSVVCARIEHAEDDPSGAVRVTREAACVDTASGTTLLRVALASPGPYVPRRELAFAGRTLVAMHPGPDGMQISSWIVADGGAR